MSMSLPQPLPENRDRAPQLYAAFWAHIPILTLVLAARFWVRIRMRNLGLDDWLMLLAFILFIICNALGTVYVMNGGARHVYYIQPPSQIVKILHLAAIAQPFGAIACAIAKTSVAGLTLRIAGPNIFWRKWLLYVCIAILMAFTVVDCTLKFAQCTPVRANWDILIPPTEKHCWNPHISASVSVANSAFTVFVDFVLAIVPCTIVWNLKVDNRTKAGLIAFLGLGVFAGIAAAIKTEQLRLLANRTDFTWGVFDMYVWTEVELALVIFCGCIPPIKPLFDRLRKGKPIMPSGAKSSGTGPSRRSVKLGSSFGSSGQRSTKMSDSLSKTNATTIVGEEDEAALYEKPKHGGITVSRQYDVESQHSQSIPSLDERSPRVSR